MKKITGSIIRPAAWIGNNLRRIIKKLLFPGLDLHTRCRYRYLPRFFSSGAVETLDAGCGNGALSYQAYKLGNIVLGINLSSAEVERNRRFFGKLGVDPRRLSFEVYNIYDLAKLGRKFGQIICSETLEHILDDKLVIGHFYNALEPGGVLHLCAPYALHPAYAKGEYLPVEDGGHLRAGYTLETYRALLEPHGFTIETTLGLGTPVLVKLDKFLARIRYKFGDWAAIPFFFLTLPLQLLDHPVSEEPFSLYVKAIKSKQG